MGCRMSVVVVVLVAALLAAASRTWADDGPKPVISGVAQEGETLTAHADFDAEDAAAVTWQWLRCRPDKSGSCVTIAGATADSYRVGAADVGFRLRVLLTVVDTDGESENKRSKPTAVVVAAPVQTPAPSPPPPSPSESTPPPPAPPILEQPPSQTAPQPSRRQRRRVRPRLLDPFPTVRIRGRLTNTGARVTLLTVRAPRHVRIAVRCHGGSCPVRRLAVAAAVTRLRRFERVLRAGTRLEIQVTKHGYIGKWSVIRIRRGRPPARSDRCVFPGGRRAVRCPAS